MVATDVMLSTTNSSSISPATGRLRVSIVCYASNEPQLRATLDTLLHASQVCLERKRLIAVDVFLVDNGPTAAERRKLANIMASIVAPTGVHLQCVGSGENIGFGAGHNLTLAPRASAFHLILNPDVELAPDALSVALDFMDAHPDCGIIAPAVANRAGETEYLCKRYPAILDLILRGFAPAWLRSLFEKRLARYEMRDVLADAVVWQPPLISGCFMLLRSTVLARLKGFSPDYFLYFEDYDLSLRAHAVTRVAYVPMVRVVHHGGYAAQKGWRHIVLFARSAVTFFNHHGWRWC